METHYEFFDYCDPQQLATQLVTKSSTQLVTRSSTQSRHNTMKEMKIYQNKLSALKMRWRMKEYWFWTRKKYITKQRFDYY